MRARMGGQFRAPAVGRYGGAGNHAAWVSRDLPYLGRRPDQLSREIIEAALAHAMKDKVEAAYTRTDLLDTPPCADGGLGGACRRHGWR